MARRFVPPPGDRFICSLRCGAYKGRNADFTGPCYTHAASSEGEAPLVPWCAVKAERLSYDDAPKPGQEPSCPTCLRRWRAADAALEAEIARATAYAIAVGEPGDDAPDIAERMVREYAERHGVPDRGTTLRLAQDAVDTTRPTDRR
jgi:hypothetical protein